VLGYAIFILGAVLEIFGYRVGVPLSIPGGLFEIVFAVLLIGRGFPELPSSPVGRPAVIMEKTAPGTVA
jgi:hypothetical protein